MSSGTFTSKNSDAYAFFAGFSGLWEQINHIAIDKRLSMAQAVLQAIEEYCKREGRK